MNKCLEYLKWPEHFKCLELLSLGYSLTTPGTLNTIPMAIGTKLTTYAIHNRLL